MKDHEADQARAFGNKSVRVKAVWKCQLSPLQQNNNARS